VCFSYFLFSAGFNFCLRRARAALTRHHTTGGDSAKPDICQQT
jgi:hypothetical protein